MSFIIGFVVGAAYGFVFGAGWPICLLFGIAIGIGTHLLNESSGD